MSLQHCYEIRSWSSHLHLVLQGQFHRPENKTLPHFSRVTPGDSLFTPHIPSILCNESISTSFNYISKVIFVFLHRSRSQKCVFILIHSTFCTSVKSLLGEAVVDLYSKNRCKCIPDMWIPFLMSWVSDWKVQERKKRRVFTQQERPGWWIIGD